jgi:hypothetical protein
MGVGFEFEFGWHVKRVHRTSMPGVDVEFDFPKYHVFFEGNGFNLECDPPGLEFVVKPPVDETDAGRLRLVRIMRNIDAMCVALGRLYQSGRRRMYFSDLTTIALGPDHVGWVEPELVVKASADISAVPQINAGLRMNRIRTVLRDMANPGSDANRELVGLGGNPDYYARRINEALAASDIRQNPRWVTAGSAHRVSAKLRGMLALIAQYVEGGARRPGYDASADALKYAKAMTYLMARTDFGKMFRMLPQDEQNFYKANGGTEFRKLVRLALRMSVADMDRYIIERGLRDGRGGVIQIPITRREWITRMTEGRDVLRENSAVYNYSESFGSLGPRVDRVKNGTHRGLVLEFRQVGELPRRQWPTFALDAFDYIRSVNRDTGATYSTTL